MKLSTNANICRSEALSKKTYGTYIKITNDKRSSNKVNKEYVKIRKTFSNVGYNSLTFVFMFVQK